MTRNAERPPGRVNSTPNAERFDYASPPLAKGGLGGVRPAFTLIEMVVVLAIIILVLSITLPGLTNLWSQRNESEVETSLRGLLATARMQALNKGERGLFFCVVNGEQRAYPIERTGVETSNPLDNLDDSDDETNGVTEPDTVDRFRVVEGQVVTLPKPLRVVPRNVVEPQSGPSELYWADAELLNEDYQTTAIQEPQRHRSFFSVIFSPDGRLSVGRSVIVWDAETGTNDDNIGDRTGLEVGDTKDYYDETGMPIQTVNGNMLNDMIVDGGGKAINFVSVDGLIIYDESAFKDLPASLPTEKRNFLLRTGQPLYVSRATGSVVVGPLGENQ